jgi:hypothetical protein
LPLDYPLSGAIDIGISRSLYNQGPKEAIQMKISIEIGLTGPLNIHWLSALGRSALKAFRRGFSQSFLGQSQVL